tara:strand:+ start:252 stop:893 length:642 start_codon:yes stop_codon:yes gene_type:complete
MIKKNLKKTFNYFLYSLSLSILIIFIIPTKSEKVTNIKTNGYELLFDISYILNPYNCNQTVIRDTLLFFPEKVSIGDYKCILEDFHKNNFKKIKIYKNFGGNGFEAYRISNFISKNNIEVSIEDYCLSACAFIFMSSQKPHAEKHSMIGLHQSNLYKTFPFSDSYMIENFVTIFRTNNSQFNAHLFNKIIEETEYDDIKILSFSEMKKKQLIF